MRNVLLPASTAAMRGSCATPRAKSIGARSDVRVLLAPDEEDEVRDGEQEGDARDDQQHSQRLLELEDDDQPRDRREDRQTPEGRVDPREEPAHVPVMYARTASAPATKVAPVNHASRPCRSVGAYIHGASTASSASVPYK